MSSAIIRAKLTQSKKICFIIDASKAKQTIFAVGRGYTHKNGIFRRLCSLRTLTFKDLSDSLKTEFLGTSEYYFLLQRCLRRPAAAEAKLVHAHMILTASAAILDSLICNLLTTIYAKCSSIEDASKLFKQNPRRDLVSWTTMISSYAKKEETQRKALECFRLMKRDGFRPDQFTFASILPACDLGLLNLRQIHCEILKCRYEGDLFVGNALVGLYGKCGVMEDACHVFEKMAHHDVVSWNSMLFGFLQNGSLQRAVELFDSMPVRNVVSWTTMVGGYARNGFFEEAVDLFQRMPEKSLVSWNAIISGFAQNGGEKQALLLFREMISAGSLPNSNSLSSVLSGCSGLRAFEQGKMIHGLIVKVGLLFDVFVGNALMDMYGKCGDVAAAANIFDRMPVRSPVTWTIIISGYSHNGAMDAALKHLRNMPDFNCGSWTAVIAGYLQEGNVRDAEELFYKMPEKNPAAWTTMISGFMQNGLVYKALEMFQMMPQNNFTSYNTMISGFAQQGHAEQALKLFKQMVAGNFRPNHVIMSGVLKACSNLAALKQGSEVHGQILRNGLVSLGVSICNSLIDMYAKCGKIETARRVFNSMLLHDVVSLNAMIFGYAMHGHYREAFELFDEIENSDTRPDDVTFLGLLTACCHAGLLDDGWKYFNCMTRKYGIRPSMEIYGCMVDILSRAGQLDQAYDFIKKMPIETHPSILRSFLRKSSVIANMQQ